MADLLKRLLNELPTVAIGIWALLNVVGVDLSADQQEAMLASAESAIGFGIWLLVRRNTDGPVTVYEKHDEDEEVQH